MESVTVTIRGINIHYIEEHPDAKKTIVMLHGFTGSTLTWRETIASLGSSCRVIAIDLTGHGLTDAPKEITRYSMEEQVADLEALFEHLQLNSFVLLGYSMGGRVALAYALSHPDRIETLMLESASPGLRTMEERLVRRANDEKLAERIEREGVEPFVDFWEDIPLFASQKKLSKESMGFIRQERLQNSVVGLANSLKGLGTGQQPSYWEDLQHFTKPVVLWTGELDTKFCKIASIMDEYFPNSSHFIFSDVGHAIHVENPVQFATMIKERIFN